MDKRTITPETRAKWRAAALKNQPWRYSTGPKTAEGKDQAVRNGKKRQSNPLSHREIVAFAKQVRVQVRAADAYLKEAEKELRRRAADDQRSSETDASSCEQDLERKAPMDPSPDS